MKNRRYSDDNRHFWPFTWSVHSDSGWRPLGVMLDSGGDHESSRNKGCNLKLHGFGRTLIVELPRLLADFHTRRGGEVFPCEYGFTVSEGTVHLHYGPQTHDSITTRSKVLWIPWRQLRHVRHCIYGLEGELLWSKPKKSKFEVYWWAKAAAPKAAFEFDDYDGQRITATTHIEEREWRHGTGLFKWLSLVRSPQISRSLSINFSKEVGPEKGSWKGGTIGHSIEMRPGELHEAAFRRYCETGQRSKHRTHNLTFVGSAPAI